MLHISSFLAYKHFYICHTLLQIIYPKAPSIFPWLYFSPSIPKQGGCLYQRENLFHIILQAFENRCSHIACGFELAFVLRYRAFVFYQVCIVPLFLFRSSIPTQVGWLYTRGESYFTFYYTTNTSYFVFLTRCSPQNIFTTFSIAEENNKDVTLPFLGSGLWTVLYIVCAVVRVLQH